MPVAGILTKSSRTFLQIGDMQDAAFLILTLAFFAGTARLFLKERT
jgi:hypothetical protein